MTIIQGNIQNAVSQVAERLERLTFNYNIVGSNRGPPDERSNREASRGIGFYCVYLVRLLRPTAIFLCTSKSGLQSRSNQLVTIHSLQ